MAKNTKYVSEATLFLREMAQEKPELQEKKKVLRKTWWDRDIDFKELKEFDQSTAPKKPHGYAYYD